jgi:hypothetical protein
MHATKISAPSSNYSYIGRENSIFFRTIAFIPLVGIFPSLIQEISLIKKIYKTEDNVERIKLINLNNQYKFANAISSIITAALVVKGIALGIFGGTLGVFLAAPNIILAGVKLYKIYKNFQIVSYLKQNPFTPQLKVK